MYEFSIGEDKTKINYKIERIGADLDITIIGGKAHIGSLVLITNNSYNLLNVANHREDELIIPFIKKFRKYEKGTIVIKAGIHINNITPHEIKEIMDNNIIAIGKIEEYIKTL